MPDAAIGAGAAPLTPGVQLPAILAKQDGAALYEADEDAADGLYETAEGLEHL